ncbi:MAG: MarR family transcriptional regulator, partial [Deltaproteobacteria bacterium]
MAKKAAPRAASAIAKTCLATQIRRLDRVITRIYDDELRPYGIKSTQLTLLANIALAGEIQPGELGRELDLEKSTVSRNVARLIDAGWVRSRKGEDARSVELQITPAGRRLLDQAHAGWKAAQKKARSLLGAKTADA